MINKEQLTIIIFITIVMVLAIWNLVLSIQNNINNKKFNEYKKRIKETDKEIEEKKNYYGWFK